MGIPKAWGSTGCRKSLDAPRDFNLSSIERQVWKGVLRLLLCGGSALGSSLWLVIMGRGGWGRVWGKEEGGGGGRGGARSVGRDEGGGNAPFIIVGTVL